jgi:putative ABC transport system permease protein
MMLSDLLFRFRALFGRPSVEQELDDELRFHIDHEAQKLMRSGISREEASRRVRVALGGLEQVKEDCRDARGISSLETIFQDLRYAMRGLRRNPGLTLVGTGMLTLGLSASTAVFSIFQAALLRPLPFPESDRLVELWETRQQRGINQASFAEANFWDVRTQNRSFEEVAASVYYEANLTGIGPAEKVTGAAITAGFFRTLGVSPVLGRDFSYDEVRAGFDNDVAILGNRFWRSRFGADPHILGRTLRLNDRAYIVVGILPAGEPWLNNQIYVPFGYRPDANRSSWEFTVIGRLARGVSAETARADLQRIAAGLEQAHPKHDKGIGMRLESSSTWIARDNTRRALSVLLGAVTFLLLIACLNIANLLLARGTARQREIAIRTALGASRMRLVRFVMMESILLSAFGAAVGVALAHAALGVIRTADIRGIPRLADADLNLWVLGFAVLTALLTGLLAGLAPALQAPAHRIAAVLRDGDRQTGSRSQGRLRTALVTSEVALSFVLLVCAGLLIRSFTQLIRVDRGFQTENRLVFSVNMPDSYWKKGVGKQFLDRFFERFSSVPEVLAAGAVSHRPVEGGDPGMGIDSPAQTGRAAPWAGWRVVSPGYFRAIGLPMLRGRAFEESDKPVWAEPGQPVPTRRVVISERLATLIFPNEDPIGKHVLLWKGQGNMDAEVIGVVGDSRERGPASGPTRVVYLPYGVNALPSEFVVHTRGNPIALVPTVRSIAASLDSNLPVSDVRSFEEVVHRSVAPQRLSAILLGVFSGLALLLATIGIYGVLSYSMSRRTAEIGLRVALGASRRDILGMTIGQGMRPALLGIVLGLVAAWWLSRYLATLLFGVKPFDAVTYFAGAALILATALAACYLPGRRATRIDPSLALRID